MKNPKRSSTERKLTILRSRELLRVQGAREVPEPRAGRPHGGGGAWFDPGHITTPAPPTQR